MNFIVMATGYKGFKFLQGLDLSPAFVVSYDNGEGKGLYYKLIQGFCAERKIKLYNKKNDGKTIWTLFVKKSISILKPNGLLSMIIPSIWLKPDRAKMHDYMLSYQLHKIHCLTNTQTNQIFKKQAQTPTCFFYWKRRRETVQFLSTTRF